MTESTITKYYYAGSQGIATLAPGASVGVRSSGTLYFMLGDHLGSTSLVTFANGNVVSQQYYKAWGETRHSNGTTPTNYTFTGQYSNMGDFGLMFYNARWYDPSIGRFAQADTVVPGKDNPQAYDRYAYTLNDPLKYIDPTGHDS